MRSEAELIEHLRSTFRATGALRVGIGDDAAVIAGDARRDWVVTTDLLIEDVHFLRRAHSPQALGWKALARSLSDIAAMGARPRYVFVALALPPGTPTGWAKQFFAGLTRLARRHHVQLAGGDVSTAKEIVADVQVIGSVRKGRAVLRSGGRPGDKIFVSGVLGLAGLGLACLRARVASVQPSLKRAVRAHLLPQPRLRLAQALARRGPTSMIDVSDGLSTDLNHLCVASRCGARVYTEQIPAVKLAPRLERRLGISGLDLAMNAGEDYELLFTLPPAQAARLPRKLEGTKLTAIGELTDKQEVALLGARGTRKALRPRGWDPFRQKP